MWANVCSVYLWLWHTYCFLLAVTLIFKGIGRIPCTSRVQGRGKGTTLSTSDLHKARATIHNPFYNMAYKIIKNIGQNTTWIEADKQHKERYCARTWMGQKSFWNLRISAWMFDSVYIKGNQMIKEKEHNKTWISADIHAWMSLPIGTLHSPQELFMLAMTSQSLSTPWRHNCNT